MAAFAIAAMLGIFGGAAYAEAPIPKNSGFTSQEVLAALSQRSGMSEQELLTLIADCTANQSSLYFCAYRDVVKAELKLKQTANKKAQRFPACSAEVENKVMHWKATAAKDCTAQAKQDWSGGSMEPTAQAICVSKRTEAMTRRLFGMHDCAMSR